ncbi:MAG: hypothetical protein M3450_06530 [Actinomycetota bacterium]|nr:hypothetical protein [Actinomycetota bacterium]
MTRRTAIVLASILALIGIGVGVVFLSDGDEEAVTPEIATVDRPTPDDEAPQLVERRASRASVVDEANAIIAKKGEAGDFPPRVRRELKRKLSQPGSTGCESVEVGKKRSIGLCVAGRVPHGD